MKGMPAWNQIPPPAQLEREVDARPDGVRRLGEDGLGRPRGPSEGPFADAPLATLVLHIHRELIHHLAEKSLLMDLYAHGRRTTSRCEPVDPSLTRSI